MGLRQLANLVSRNSGVTIVSISNVNPRNESSNTSALPLSILQWRQRKILVQLFRNTCIHGLYSIIGILGCRSTRCVLVKLLMFSRLFLKVPRIDSSMTLFQSLATSAGWDPVEGPGSSCTAPDASGQCVLPWSGGIKAVSSIVLIANGIRMMTLISVSSDWIVCVCVCFCIDQGLRFLGGMVARFLCFSFMGQEDLGGEYT